MLATARLPVLEGNLLHLDDAIRTHPPGPRVVLLLQPYSYDLAGQAALPRPPGPRRVPPAHVAAGRRRQRLPAGPRRAAPAGDDRGPGVARARARSSGSAPTRGGGPRRARAHVPPSLLRLRGRAGDGSREPWSGRCGRRSSGCCRWARRGPTCFYDTAALDAASPCPAAIHPVLAGRTVVLYAPTFRGRGARKVRHGALDGTRLRAASPADVRPCAQVPSQPRPVHASRPRGFDVVADPRAT